jgi:predicted nucleic acid-binding protein
MAVVLDSSAVAPLALLDEDRAYSFGVLDAIRDRGGLVPDLWWFEIRNVMVICERRGRLSAEDSHRFLGMLATLAIGVDHTPDEAAVLRMAREQRLTVYDAAYLELAWRTSSPLATQDRQLASAARACGVVVH